MPPSMLSPRAVRGLALIAVSLIGLAVVVVLHVRPAASPGPLAAAVHEPDATSTMDWVSDREGWISAFDRPARTSTLFHTTDGGRHWSRQRVAHALETPRFFDSMHGVLTSDLGAFRTADGGRHWEPMAVPGSARNQQPAFADDRHAWVWSPSPAGLFATADGGESWRRLPAVGLPAGPAAPRLLGFRDALHGWLAEGGVLYGTADGGRSWRLVPLAPTGPDHTDLGPLSVAPDGRGQLLLSGPTSAWISVTADGGATWSAPRPLPPGASNLAPGRADGASSWAWAPGELLVTRDAGDHWTVLALPAWSLLRVRAIDARTVWVASTVVDALGVDRWTLFSSRDAGITWNPAITPALG